MNRQEFIITLREGLKKLPPEEIVAATEYFQEYFDEVLEAGEKTEEEIVQELGNPRKIAAKIRADYAARILDGDESMLNGKPSVGKRLSAVWWVIIGIASAPVSIPIAICTVCILIGVICFIIGIAAGVIGVIFAGIGTVVFGCMALADAVSTGIMLIGIGLVCIAAAAAAGAGTFLGVRAAVRAIARAIKRKRETHRMKGFAEMRDSDTQWTYAPAPDPEEEAFMKEFQADAEEAESERGLVS